MTLALPLWLVVATPCFYVVGFLVLARGWWLERRRAERLHEMLDRYDVKARDLVAASIPINEEITFWRGEATYWQAEQAAAHAKVKALRGQLLAERKTAQAKTIKLCGKLTWLQSQVSSERQHRRNMGRRLCVEGIKAEQTESAAIESAAIESAAIHPAGGGHEA